MILGILLSSSPECEDVHTVIHLAEAAVRQGHQVKLFLMCDGVHNAGLVKPLLAKGVSVTLCATNAEQRGLERVDGVVFGSQYDWAEIVHCSDRVLAFG